LACSGVIRSSWIAASIIACSVAVGGATLFGSSTEPSFEGGASISSIRFRAFDASQPSSNDETLLVLDKPRSPVRPHAFQVCLTYDAV
jgi:hypothetical protein